MSRRNAFPSGFHPLVPLFGVQRINLNPLLQKEPTVLQGRDTPDVFQGSVRTCNKLLNSPRRENSPLHSPTFSLSWVKQLSGCHFFFSISSFLPKTTNSPNVLQNEPFFYLPPFSLYKKGVRGTCYFLAPKWKLRERACRKAVYSERLDLFCLLAFQGQQSPAREARSSGSSTRPSSPSSCYCL